MNKNIKKISNGAMFLAIVGAALLVNRGLSFIFDEYVSIISSVVLVVYIKKFSFKDGLMLAFGIFFLSFMFGGTYVLMYCPLAIIAGLAYGYGVSRDYDSKRILFMLIVIYTIGEFIIMFVMFPLLGFGDINDMIATVQEMLAYYNITMSSESLLSFAKMAYVVSTFILAVIEAVLLHLVSVLIFKKFKLGEIRQKPLSEIRIKPIYAYISIIAMMLTVYAFGYIQNDAIVYSLMAVALLGGTLLMAQGYIFCLVYGIIVLKKNISLILILVVLLLMPYSFILLIILGFLYSTGPLYRYIVKKRGY